MGETYVSLVNDLYYLPNQKSNQEERDSGTCSKYGTTNVARRFLASESEGKNPLKMYRSEFMDNIKLNLQKQGL